MRDPTGSAVKSAVAAHTWEIKRCGINQTWPHTHTHTALIHTQAASNIVTMKSNQALAWRPALGSSPALTPQLCSAANCGHTKSWPKAKTTARQAPPTPHPPKTPKAPIQNCCLILLRKSLTHARLQLVTGHAGHTLNTEELEPAWSAWCLHCGGANLWTIIKCEISNFRNVQWGSKRQRQRQTARSNSRNTAEATGAKRGATTVMDIPSYYLCKFVGLINRYNRSKMKKCHNNGCGSSRATTVSS